MSDFEDNSEQCKDLFIQDGVLLYTCAGRPISELNAVGMLCIVENADTSKIIEWRPNDLITIVSDVQDQEWSVVNTIGRRQRTLSGNMTSDYAAIRARIIRIPLDELNSFKVYRNNQRMQFSTKQGSWQCTFYFQHGNAEIFIANLKCHVKTAKARYDKSTYLIVEPDNDSQALRHSFAELDIYTDNTTDVVWNLVSNFKDRPYQTTMEAFSKLSDIVYYGNEETNDDRTMSEEVVDLLTRSTLEDTTTSTKPNDGYEVVCVKPALPPRLCIPRSSPLSTDKWEGLKDTEGRFLEVDGIKQLIFRGGVAHSIRRSVWKYLLGYYRWNMSNADIKMLQKKKTEEYYCMKLQWRSMNEGQESRFSDYRDRKSLIEKDVERTDRTHEFFAGDKNPNLVVLNDILMTYVMYNFDLGYVQGMSDILAPLLILFQNEVDSFWCFVGFMEKIEYNFDIDQAGMKLQMVQLVQLLELVSPALARHLASKDCANMYFCFRWLLVWFKREFSLPDIMRLWEVLWTGLPCTNFHLLVCVAILDIEQETIINKDYGFPDVLKHVNDLSMKLDVEKILSTAEGIYHQIISSSHTPDAVRHVLGIPTVAGPPPEPDAGSPPEPDAGSPPAAADTEEVTLECNGLRMSVVTRTMWALLA